MNTIFDWITVALFCCIAVIFLQRSVEAPRAGDSAFLYAPPAIGCAAANWLGNEHYIIAAVLMLVVVAIYTVVILKPNWRV